MKIAVIVAMEKELERLVALLANEKKEVKDGIAYVVGELDGKTVILHQCGIGKVAAAIGANELINAYHPDCVISSGCAGGLGRQLKIMDVIASESTVYHDVVIDGNAFVLDIQKPYASDSYLVSKARELSKDSSLPPIHVGLICTGDHFVTDKGIMKQIREQFPDGLAVDMESCAIAQTCQFHRVPFISFRVISDTADAQSKADEYNDFWASMADNSFTVVRHYLASL